jgi:hypothetical protein
MHVLLHSRSFELAAAISLGRAAPGTKHLAIPRIAQALGAYLAPRTDGAGSLDVMPSFGEEERIRFGDGPASRVDQTESRDELAEQRRESKRLRLRDSERAILPTRCFLGVRSF